MKLLLSYNLLIKINLKNHTCKILMHLTCDYREHKITKILNEKKIEFIAENLTIGDFIVYNDDKTNLL